MRIGRTLPPAAAPIPWTTILRATLNSFFQRDTVTETFQAQIKSYFSKEHCFTVSSGKAALTIILQALQKRFPEKTEVLIPAYTCFSVPAAIKRAGLKVKLCDIDINSLDFDKTMLQKIALQQKEHKTILTVIPTHLYGLPANIDYCRELFGREIPIIEDAAQAMGNCRNGEKLGTAGDIGFFSLGRGKGLSAIAGGIIITDNSDFAEIIERRLGELETHTAREKVKLILNSLLTAVFQNPSLFWFPKGIPALQLGETIYDDNFPIKLFSSFQADLLRDWEERLESHNRIRNQNIFYLLGKKTWDNNTHILVPDSDKSLIRLPCIAASHLIREDIIIRSEDKGLGIMPGYPSTVNEIPELHDHFINEKYPSAREVAERIFTLPVSPLLTRKDLDKIADEFILPNSGSQM